MRLQHFTDRPFTLDTTRVYQQLGCGFTFDKPRGLWVSVAGPADWPTWCRGEDFHVDSLRHVADIELAADHRVRVITTVAELDGFTRAYQAPPSPRLHRLTPGIDWHQVTRDHDGLIVATWLYDWSWTLSDDPRAWLWGWDCTSGCIWNLDAIATVTPAIVEAVTTR